MISVIVPVHNTFLYIEECIESIRNQTYSDLEIICIDSSTDGTTSLLKKIACDDLRIQVIIDSNNSYGYKINLGIRLAMGEYISIIDSDDYIQRNMYENLLNVLLENNADFVKSDHSSFCVENDKNVILEYHENILDHTLYGKCLDCRLDVSILYKTGISIWTGLYRKSFLIENDILLNESEGASFQDAGFSVLTHVYGRKIYYLHKSFYQYRTDNINSSVKSQKKYKTIAEEWDFIDSQIESRGLSNKDLIAALRMRKLMNYEWNIERLDEKSSRKFALFVNDELRVQYLESGLEKYMMPEFQIKFDKVFERGLRYVSVETQKIIDLIKTNKVVLVGTEYLGYKILYHDVIRRCFDVQKIYDIEEKVIEVDGFYMNVERINTKIYTDDSLYFIADKKNEKRIEELLENAGINKEQIYKCPRIFYPYLDLESMDKEEESEKEILVSIVVVVKWNNWYLKESLQDFIKQTLKRIEIIYVIDGSAIEDLTILKQMESKDSRIKIAIRKDATDARKIGMQNAQGKYIMFCDCNDMLKKDAARKLFELAEEKKAEIICYDAKYIYMNEQLAAGNSKIDYYQREFSYGQGTGKEILIRMVENNDYYDQLNLMFFNRKWMQKKELSIFDETLYEDCAFSIQCLVNADKVYHTNEEFYIYRISQDYASMLINAEKLYGKYINLKLLNEFIGDESFEIRQEWALAEIVRKVSYDIKKLAVEIDEWETEKLLSMPLSYIMKVELEQYGVNSRLVQRNINREYSGEKLEKALNNAEKIEIYGAGVRGKRLLDYLIKHGYSKKVCNFVVSTKIDQEEKIKGIDVLAVDDGWKPCEDRLLVIAFMGEEAKEVYKSFRNKGIKNLLLLDDDMARFMLQDAK